MGRARRRGTSKRPLAWLLYADTSGVDTATTYDDLKVERQRLVDDMDARFGAGVGEDAASKLIDTASTMARLLGVENPERMGANTFERGVGYVGA